jgi:hypothetical protein
MNLPPEQQAKLEENRVEINKIWRESLLRDDVQTVALLMPLGYGVGTMITDVNFDGRTTCSSLELVSLFRGNKVIPLLLKNDVPRSLPDQAYVEAMFISLTHSTPEVIKAFLDHGVPLDARNEQGYPLLIYAASDCREKILDLIDLGFDLEVKDKNGLNVFEYKEQVLDHESHYPLSEKEQAIFKKLELLRSKPEVSSQSTRPKSRL